MEEAQINVDVEASLSEISESMQRELNKLWGNTNEAENITIFRTPHNISQSKKNLFEPSIISIGPFHHDKEHLRPLQKQKWWFLQDFLSRGDHISLDLCISEMKSLEEETRRCYSETVDLGSNAFVEMMLLDGCFVLEFFLKMFKYNGNTIEFGWNYSFIMIDLLLLENQIPFFIVEKLLEIGLKEERMLFVKTIAFYFFLLGPSNNMYFEDEIPDPPGKIHHLVHLCYHYLVPYPEEQVVLSSKSFVSYWEYILDGDPFCD